MVIDSTGVCVVGATVEVVRGQGLGQSLTQTTPCDAWGYDGGFMFRDSGSGRRDDPSCLGVGLEYAGEVVRSALRGTTGSLLDAVQN